MTNKKQTFPLAVQYCFQNVSLLTVKLELYFSLQNEQCLQITSCFQKHTTRFQLSFDKRSSQSHHNIRKRWVEFLTLENARDFQINGYIENITSKQLSIFFLVVHMIPLKGNMKARTSTIKTALFKKGYHLITAKRSATSHEATSFPSATARLANGWKSRKISRSKAKTKTMTHFTEVKVNIGQDPRQWQTNFSKKSSGFEAE